MIIKVLLDVNSLEKVGNRSLSEIEAILSNPGYNKELLWRSPDRDWWVHIQRCGDAERHYEVMVRDSHDDMLLYLLFKTIKEVQERTPFRLSEFRIAEAWTNDREWVL
jgi:hypothetical protein